jgi:uncharacterized protein
VRTALLDTGPLVAYLDAKDRAHGEAAAALGSFPGQLATTGAVVTEAMHLVSGVPGGPALLAAFVAASAMQVHDFAQPLPLREAAARMEQYADTPMDYADATLVLLAERLSVLDVFTLDRRGFSTYRTRDGKAFRNLLGPG